MTAPRRPISEPRPTAAGPGARMAWLDALRAVAVLLVLYAHLSRHLLQDVRAVTSEWLHAGTAGVMLFFLVSGYIIPASLHRHGDLRAFWRSRLLRLFPLYLVVSTAVVILGVTGRVPLAPWLVEHPAAAVTAHATMLPLFLGVPLLTPVFWTLSFEMAFYLIVTALFAVRRRAAAPVPPPAATGAPDRPGAPGSPGGAGSRGGSGASGGPGGSGSRGGSGGVGGSGGPGASGGVGVEAALAVLLAVVAAASAPLTPRLLAASPAMVEAVTAVGAVLLVVGLAGVVSGRPGGVRAGGVLLGVLAVVLLTVNQDPSHVWDGLLILAVMFTGTVVHRADRGLTSWWPVVVTGSVVAAATLVVWFAELVVLNALTPRYQTRSVLTLLVIGGGFAAGMALRHRPVPAWVARVGVLSYSVYLVHYVLLQALGPVLEPVADAPLPAQVAATAVVVAVLLGICELTYRFVELPAQRLARRRTRQPVDARAVGPGSQDGRRPE